jgi:hypothetical protein
MGKILLGLTAGAAGTAAMTVLQELLPRLVGGGEPSEDSSDEEPPPAQAARKLLGAVGIEPAASWTPVLTQATHWAYGTGWGAAYALLRDHTDANAPTLGLGFGLGVWIASYLQLVPLGIYEPPWTYPPATLAEDLSYHAAYGLGVAATYASLPA